MAGTGITGGIGALDLQTFRSMVGASMHTILTELKTGTGINTNAITTVKLNALAVTAAKIGTNAITTPKVNASAVTTAKIAANAVTTAKVAAGTLSLGSGTDGATAGDVNAKFQVVTTAGADTIVTVAHGLSRAPTGFLAVDKDKASDVYDDGTAWTTANIYLKFSVATVVATLLIF